MFNKVLFILIFAAGAVFGQKVLTLEEALDIALSESYQMKSAKFNLLSSMKNLEATKLGNRSSVSMEFDLPNYSRTLSGQFNTTTGSEEFFEVGNTTWESRLFITQPIVFSNGTLSLVGSLFGRDQYSGFSGDSKDYYSNLSIRLYQPFFIFNSQSASLERAEINLRKTERNYSQAERDLVYNVTNSFYNLYKARKNMEITSETVEQTNNSYQTAANKLKAGLIAEVEALQLEVDLATSKNDLLDAERRYEERLNSFKLLIGVEQEDKISIIPSLEYDPVDVNFEEAFESALKNRPDLLNATEDLKLGLLQIDEVDSRTTIKAELTANYGINKNDPDFDNVFRDFLDTRSVVMKLSVPVWDWGKNSREVEAAEAEQKLKSATLKNLKKSIRNEILAAVNQVKSSTARVEALAKTVEVARKTWEISVERFNVGKITSFDLSQVQLRLTNAQLASLSALIDYKVAIADLERKTFLKY